MSDREKLLGMVIGGLLVLFAMIGGFRMWKGGLDDKNAEVQRLRDDLKTARMSNQKAKGDVQLVSEYQKRSLPADPAQAHLQFNAWLTNQVNAVGLEDDSIKFEGIPTSRKAEFKELSYLVNGVGNIKQVNELLYRLHSVDNLLRVRSLDLVKKKEKEQLQINLWVDALSMPGNDSDKIEIGKVVESKLARTMEEYEERITQRNLFSPGNQAPKLATRTQRVELGERLNYKIAASDPDGHGLIFELGDDAPKTMDITKAGTLTWRPKEIGEVEFTVYVTDKGFPAKEDEATLKVRVVEKQVAAAPPKEEEFDEAKVAVLTAIVQGAQDPMPQMCVYLRSKDESQYLQQGDKIKIGKWSGRVIFVDPDRNTARLEKEDGQFILKLGEALADAKKIDPNETF